MSIKRLTLLTTSIFMTSYFITFSATYYVAPNGSDSNAGSIASPFKTIQKAAGSMVAGDVCYIREGTYHETITLANSGTSTAPITISAYQNETVIVSGADIISGWTLHNGNIYKAPMSWDMGEGKNQVFVNGKMMLQSRYPNSSTEDLLQPSLTRMVALKNLNLVRGIDLKAFPDNYFNNGLLWASLNPSWTSQTAKIVSFKQSDPAYGNSPMFTITQKSNPWYPDADGSGGGSGYITGLLSLLDTASEWHYENATLYLWAPGNVNPSTMIVEAKRRSTVLVMGSNSWIVVKGINFFSGTGNMNGTNCTIDGCTFKYINHQFTTGGYGGISGFAINGSNNKMINSEVSFSVGSGFSMQGTNNAIRNCLFHDIGYVGDYDGCTGMGGSNNRVEYCTFYHFSAFAIRLGGGPNYLRYNHAYDYGYLVQDVPAFNYSYGHNGNRTEIAYNIIHDNHTTFGSNCGVYLDDNNSNFDVHHNVFWNLNQGVMVKGSGHTIVNNTGFNLYGSETNPNKKIICPFRSKGGLEVPLYADSNNLDLYNNPLSQLVAPANYNFTLKPGASAIDAGGVFAPWTNGYSGSKPDRGAFESGATAWTAGCDLTIKPVSVSPAGGVFTFTGAGTVPVTLVCATSGADIYYTTDGSEPTQASTKYSGQFSLSQTITIKARAYKNGILPGVVTTALLVILPNNHGLHYKYYEGCWLDVPNFDTLTPVSEGISENFKARYANKSTCTGLVFNGYIDIPTGGNYSFFLNTTTGGKMYVRDSLIIDQKGRTPGSWRTGTIRLNAGVYPIKITYFKDSYYSTITNEKLIGVEYSLMNEQMTGYLVPRQPIPDNVLYLTTAGMATTKPAFIQKKNSVEKIKIFNLKGALVKDVSFLDGKMPRLNLPQGTYIVRMYDSHASVQKKVVLVGTNKDIYLRTINQ